MIDLYYWPTPNGWKISIALEELGLPYTLFPINIGKGDQHAAAFLEKSPNNRIPAIVDHAPQNGGAQMSVFESGAILLYLAEKTGQLCSTDARVRVSTLEWLFWQVGGLGPMAGQAHHFRQYAPDKIEYAISRYTSEVARLYKVMNTRLGAHEYLAGADYSIADIASFPWLVPHKNQGQDLNDFPHLKRWFAAVGARPAVQRGLAVGKALQITPVDDAAKKILFGHSAKER